LQTSSGSVAAQLFDIIHQATAEMERIPGVQAISFEFYAVAARQSAVRDYLRSYFGEFRDGLAAIIQRGIDSGEFRIDVDPQAAAFTVVALMEGLALLWMMDPQAVRPASDGEQALHLLLDGMRVPCPPMSDG
ncbi:MAG: TetR family transcriptional regulator C-terminal domain-containing protein, partial [Chloroflexota bacterium]